MEGGLIADYCLYKHEFDICLKKARLKLHLLPELNMIDRQFLIFPIVSRTIGPEVRDGNLKSVMTKEKIWN